MPIGPSMLMSNIFEFLVLNQGKYRNIAYFFLWTTLKHSISIDNTSHVTKYNINNISVYWSALFNVIQCQELTITFQSL